MLRLLRIRNFAIIDKLELEFHPGFNAITGETGAGKSIILDAISMILGNRANLDIIRSGAEEATVEAVFDFEEVEPLIEKFSAHGIEVTASELKQDGIIIKRTLQKSGKNKIYFCGELISVSQLSDLCSGLVDLCSQHEHQSLSKPDLQIELLDRYGGLYELRKKTSSLFETARLLEKELAELGGSLSDRARTEDFLQFQLSELGEFDPKPGEEESLLSERKKLTNSSQILSVVQEIAALLGNSDYASTDSALSVRDLLAKSQQRLSKIEALDDKLSSLRPSLDRAVIEIEELLSELDSYLQSIDLDPNKLEKTEDRLNLYSEMKRKYGASFDEIMTTKQKLEEELKNLHLREKRAKELEQESAAAQDQLLKSAEKLSQKRASVSTTLQKSIEAELHELMMKGAQFQIALEKNLTINSNGIDRINFLFSANTGESPKPLSKVASGGELSRVLLAIRRTIADQGGVGVYLFDEIDSGIGGQTASVVGRKLKSVSQYNQVICITHLPQVAAFADMHFSVSKKAVTGRTLSQIEALEPKERIDEIARMLGGLNITDKSRAHARDLISQAKAQ